MTIHVQSSEGLRCQRCAVAAYLTVTIPHPSFAYPESQPRSGMITFALCPRCDKRNPHTQGLLAYFSFYGDSGDGDAEVLAVLVDQWVASLHAPPDVDVNDFESDVDAYRRGDFD